MNFYTFFQRLGIQNVLLFVHLSLVPTLGLNNERSLGWSNYHVQTVSFTNKLLNYTAIFGSFSIPNEQR